VNDHGSRRDTISSHSSGPGLKDNTGEEGEIDNQNVFLESQQKMMTDLLYKMKDQLDSLSQKHSHALAQLVERHRLEYKEKETTFQKDTMELEWNQSSELKDMQHGHNEEINEANFIYLRELEMESQVRGVETKALQERKVLNSLLDTVVDGVISIDPLGEIKRFKYV
jgi:signal transduction histidine kinase